MPKTTGPLQEITLQMTVRVITDGATTTFVELIGDVPDSDLSIPLVTGVARCAPGDTFDHDTGAHLAWTRALRALAKTMEEDIPKADRDVDRLAEARRRVRELKRKVAELEAWNEQMFEAMTEMNAVPKRTPADAKAKDTNRRILGKRR